MLLLYNYNVLKLLITSLEFTIKYYESLCMFYSMSYYYSLL